MRRVLDILFLSVVVVLASSCNIDEVITTSLPPKVSLDGGYRYSVMRGGCIELSPRYENVDGATYSWQIAGEVVSSAPSYRYEAEAVGTTLITLVVANEVGSDTISINIEVVERVIVYEYCPAPGQFIGDGRIAGFDGTELTPEQAKSYAERRLAQQSIISLGAFGGYIVMGFEQPITNNSGYDFSIRGNSFDGSSEPGVVWVMQDENGNGLPDDRWYELYGSESGLDTTIQNYSVTYYRPDSPATDVAWEDNLGGSGVVEYIDDIHTQDYYYPAWIDGDSYTLTGTRLASKSYDSSDRGSMWIQPAYGWGYADNASAVDCEAGINSFEIDNAHDGSGEPLSLESIDFVKVQSAVQQQCGWMGEVSTEITAIYDI